jgi:hypothetical protein
VRTKDQSRPGNVDCRSDEASDLRRVIRVSSVKGRDIARMLTMTPRKGSAPTSEFQPRPCWYMTWTGKISLFVTVEQLWTTMTHWDRSKQHITTESVNALRKRRVRGRVFSQNLQDSVCEGVVPLNGASVIVTSSCIISYRTHRVMHVTIGSVAIMRNGNVKLFSKNLTRSRSRSSCFACKAHLPVERRRRAAFLVRMTGANVSGKRRTSRKNTVLVKIKLRYSVQRHPR